MNKLDYLTRKHASLKKKVNEAVGDQVRVLKKEKLFVKDLLEKTRRQTEEVL
tara:strand:+ start:489 stop:644 length:156 start_codon:yes stop_codon:yes gene_type:complete